MLGVGTKVTFQERELIALVTSGILRSLCVAAEASIGADRAYLLTYLKDEAADVITARSSAGHSLKCLYIEQVADGERAWTFEVTEAPSPKSDGS